MSEIKHTPIEELWEKMSKEDWLAGHGFSGTVDGLSGIPYVRKPRIFEFAQQYADQHNADLLAKVEALRLLLLRAEMYVLPTEQTNELLKDIRKALES